jgi:hypothetical protein
MKTKLDRWLSKFYIHLLNHYAAYSVASNILIAVAMSGLALLGVLNSVLTPYALIVWGLILAAMYSVGKWLDSEVDDADKIRNRKC